MDITEESVLKSYETTEGSSVVSVKKPADYESSNAVKERAQEGPLDYFEEINMDDCAESVLKLKNTKEIMSISSNVKVDETNKQETMLNVPVDLSILDTSIIGEAPPAVGSIVNLSEVEDTEESTKPIGCLNQSYVTSKQVLLEKPEGEQKAASLGTVKTTVGKETCKEEQSNRYFVKKPLVEMRLKRKSDSIVPEPARKKRCLKVEVDSTTLNDKNSETTKKLPENFDLLGEHRPWCKWLIIHEVSGLAGWRIFIESLLRNLTEMSPSSSLDRNRVKIAVNLLSTWTYPVLRTEQLNSS
ncbi:uncharacterized protein LOC106467077 [Limulus polyphemus]|uniref:Uncharacterized protein LOC106467077 n=1 Tax=Limulus polyphemus TaxID=6850 RepID=A0ABM1T4U2_LIMPO|nr:uncharacterized protein LOC106467077 [Limulus polyphemus]